MANRIKLGSTFCFRGEYFTPSIEVDLDALMTKKGELPDFYPLLAQANDIGLYTYEFEMLEAETLTAVAIDGWVENFILDNTLDVQGFESHWHSAHLQTQLRSIADKHQLAVNQVLLEALEEAFKLGKRSHKKFSDN